MGWTPHRPPWRDREPGLPPGGSCYCPAVLEGQTQSELRSAAESQDAAGNQAQSGATEIVATAMGAARRRGTVAEATGITSSAQPGRHGAGALGSRTPGRRGAGCGGLRSGGFPPSQPSFLWGSVGSRPRCALLRGTKGWRGPRRRGVGRGAPSLGPLTPLLLWDPTFSGALLIAGADGRWQSCRGTQRAGWPRGPGRLCCRRPAAGRLTCWTF